MSLQLYQFASKYCANPTPYVREVKISELHALSNAFVDEA
jgi:hypothetical protein